MSAPTSDHTIRPALSCDVPTILRLINELADYEHALHEVQATEASLKASLSFPDTDPTTPPGFGSRVARTLLICPTETPEEVAGMALYFHNYSTWRSTAGIYLEDLYVNPKYRGRGFGKALLQALAKLTLESCGENARLEWSVLKWNRPSIDFYESRAVGAQMMQEWVGMRVDGEKLKLLAGMS
jgi:GNAT superfamily N-acetyltransferase